MVRISKDRRFEFGKYKGRLVAEIIMKDAQYIEYLCTKISWIFTDYEKQSLRNLRYRQKNKDIHTFGVKTRTLFEEEMYMIINNFKKT